MGQPRTGAQALLDALVAEDVSHFFNLPGNGLGPVLQELFSYPTLDYVLSLHEGSLIAMADGYARASGRPSFANVYMVPGTANALSTIYTAQRDKSPVVVAATQQARATVGRDAYASSPGLAASLREYTKWSWEVPTPERIPEAIHRAFQVAATPPLGPVFLSLPLDLFTAELAGPPNEPSTPAAVPTLGAPLPEQVRQMADLVAAAQRILFVCGQDVVTNGAVDAVEALARDLGAAVVSEPWNALLAFPRPHDLGFGEYNRELLERLRPDLVVGFGARMFVEALGTPEPAFPPGTRLIALGQAADELGRMYAPDIAAQVNVRAAAEALQEACRGRVDMGVRSTRLAELAAYQDEIRRDHDAMLREYHDRSPMSIARLAVELNKVIDRDTVLVEQSTTSGGMLKAFLDQPNPYNFFGTGGSVQGWGTPAAIGAQLARPDARVLGIVGDGGFVFNCQAVWTAAHYRIPVTWLVIDNRGYRSMRRNVEHLQREETPSSPDFGFDFDVDTAMVAQGFGVEVDRVSDPDVLADVMKAAIEDPKPRIVEAVISPGTEFVRSHGAPMAV